MPFLSKRHFTLLLAVASSVAAFSPCVVRRSTTAPFSSRTVTTWKASKLDEDAMLEQPDTTSVNKEHSGTEDPMGTTHDDPIRQFIHKFLATGGGEIGTRGEMYFFVQAALIVGIVLGLPVLSQHLIGSGLLLIGTVTLFLTSMDMGESITPWPKPNGQGLVKRGFYGQVRHPMYSGLLATMTGFSIWTGSLNRLLLTVLLYVAIEIKTNYEEEELIKAYPNYEDYRKEVTNKFVPKAMLELWNRSEEDE